MSIQIENYGFMVVLYVLCFVYIFYPNTEYICFIILIVLNLFYLLLFYNDIDTRSSINVLSLEIPVKMVIILWWLSLMSSNAWLIDTYRKLRVNFEKIETGINLGERKNYVMKNQIIILLIFNIILFLFLHLLSIQYSSQKSVVIDLIPKNMIKIIITLSGVVISSTLLYLNNELSTNTKIITTQ